MEDKLLVVPSYSTPLSIRSPLQTRSESSPETKPKRSSLLDLSPPSPPEEEKQPQTTNHVGNRKRAE